jgi:hypothetical protein
MADMHYFLQTYRAYDDTFKATSFDSSRQEYLCKDESQTVINFDKLIQEKYPDSNQRPRSFDALFVHEDIVFCLVYNKYVPKEERFKRGLHKSIRFEFLNQYKTKGFVNDVYAEDVNFFKKQLHKELAC